MKENKYDDPRFFEKYSHMSRSEQGLQGAGEWPTLAPLLPAFAGKRVLDLGCGYGWHCAYAADQGAASVIGVDLSAKMLETARQKNARPQVQYQQGAIEDAAFRMAALMWCSARWRCIMWRILMRWRGGYTPWLRRAGGLSFPPSIPSLPPRARRIGTTTNPGASGIFP